MSNTSQADVGSQQTLEVGDDALDLALSSHGDMPEVDRDESENFLLAIQLDEPEVKRDALEKPSQADVVSQPTEEVGDNALPLLAQPGEVYKDDLEKYCLEQSKELLVYNITDMNVKTLLSTIKDKAIGQKLAVTELQEFPNRLQIVEINRHDYIQYTNNFIKKGYTESVPLENMPVGIWIVLQNAKYEGHTKNNEIRTDHFKKDGFFEANTVEDFKSIVTIQEETIETEKGTIHMGKIGGNMLVKARPFSTYGKQGAPTLEVIGVIDKVKKKIRYLMPGVEDTAICVDEVPSAGANDSSVDVAHHVNHCSTDEGTIMTIVDLKGARL